MKISMKSQTMQKRGQKRPSRLFKRPEKKPNFICSIAIPLSQKTSKLQEHQKFLFEIKIKSCLALYWNTDLPTSFFPHIPDFSWFVKLHTFVKMVPQFAYLSIGSFLYESPSCSLPFLQSES